MKSTLKIVGESAAIDPTAPYGTDSSNESRSAAPHGLTSESRQPKDSTMVHEPDSRLPAGDTPASLPFRCCHVLQAPRVELLLRDAPAVSSTMRCDQVLDIFLSNPLLPVIPVLADDAGPVGIVDRARLIELLIRPGARETQGRTPISEVMDCSPVVVDVRDTIDDLTRRMANAGMGQIVNGFIITRAGRYAGVGGGQDLLKEMTRFKQAHLSYLTHFDQLTGLPNRMLFADRLEHARANAARRHQLVGLLLLDLDHFRLVNDTLGHEGGDLVLQTVAQRLLTLVRESDSVARLSGDQFAIVLENVATKDATNKVAQKVLNALAQPFLVRGHKFFVTASIGIAHFPQNASDADGLIRSAEAAMAQAKMAGHNTFCSALSDPRCESAQWMNIVTELRGAIEQEEFTLHYQPQVCLRTGEVTGVEALLRWQHPRLGLVAPGHFIDVAEETGLIIPLGRWVLREALRQQRKWLRQGLPPLRMSVNVSPLQFCSDDFLETLTEIARETQVGPRFIELELTERLLMPDAESTLITLTRLKEMGVRLAVDDFGKHYSSLNYLRLFPVDRLKIDQTFVRDLDQSVANAAIVQAVISLGQGLGMAVTAEGIETPEEFACIRSYGCDDAQGYYVLKPVSAGEFVAWYKKKKRQSNGPACLPDGTAMLGGKPRRRNSTPTTDQTVGALRWNVHE